MHPLTYLKLKKPIKDKKDIHLYYGMAILYEIFRKFENGNGSTTFDDLLKTTTDRADEIEHFLDIFRKENLIIEVQEDCLIPANSSKNILLTDMINLIHDVSLYVPDSVSSSNPLKKYFEDLFNKMKDSNNDILGDLSLNSIIKETG